MTKEFSLQHIIQEPKNKSQKSPVLIMLHGYGSDENDLFSFAGELPEDLFIISAKAPYSMQPYGNAWYAIHFDNNDGKFSDDLQAISSRETLKNFIDEVIQNYPVDPDNVNLLGFSQGSILSYAVALSYPEKVKNVVALSGYINQGILKDGYEKNDFSNLDFYCSHGSVDQVIPVDWARKTKPFMDELGIKNSYSEFPVGHGVAPQNFFEFKEWLQKRL
ncbi:alpha/beta fold hydrolase [Gramella lutea]|uniref:Alpha/beta fold hydrolase n=1 Tax=Christiangramia lutea TaxID=1607951 RepID=A0A9X1V221_9FLAO|nr:alpha/beta fold hydrolase [Christiangramia lutea]MCH4822967.1 alpha/beta fold hydrolase [Christiangramia lutea]